MKEMKKLMVLVLVIMMVLSLAGCRKTSTSETKGDSGKASETTSTPTNQATKEPYKALLLLNGTLGDKSFFDSANEGLTRMQELLGEDSFTFKVEQMGGSASDQPKWEPTLLDYCESGEYDVIIMGTWQMNEYLVKAATQYPDQKFIFFDNQFDFDANPVENVYNVLFKQNEVSYLVGAEAAMMTTDSSIKGINPENKIIGFIGGMDNTVVNDFLVGFIQGAKDVEPEIQVAIGYVGDFVDSAKGKSIALTQYQNGVDVGFSVAGNAGLGQIEAASENGLYAFGVDSDQATLLPEYAGSIPSSALKNVGNAIYRAISLDMEGHLEYGITETLGLAEGGVELVKGAHYNEIVPEAIRDRINDIEAKIIKGEITVHTSAGLSTDEIEAIRKEAGISQ